MDLILYYANCSYDKDQRLIVLGQMTVFDRDRCMISISNIIHVQLMLPGGLPFIWIKYRIIASYFIQEQFEPYIKYYLAMYNVDIIMDKKIDDKQGKALFLVKWINYGFDKLSWEPLENLQQNCMDLLTEFQQNYGHLKTTSIGKVFIRSDKTIKLKTNSQVKPIRKRVSRLTKNRYKTHQKPVSHFNTLIIQNSNSSNQFEENQVVFPPKEIQKQKDSNDLEATQNRRDDQHLPKEKQDISPLNSQPASRIINHSQNCDNQGHSIKSDCPNQGHSIKSDCPHCSPFERLQNLSNRDLFNANNQLQQASNQQMQSNEKRWPDQILQEVSITQKPIFRSEINIQGIKNSEHGLTFYVYRNGIKGWCSHSYLVDRYPRELCQFYQKHLNFM